MKPRHAFMLGAVAQAVMVIAIRAVRVRALKRDIIAEAGVLHEQMRDIADRAPEPGSRLGPLAKEPKR